ncbi:hypothetical protein [uncultured Spirosoma sp.]|uniref:hypothetical protein n=1 Tax=uncultured Spirosoma sp. TaxID=278208 RepID=UPI00258A97F0|nr:hypothetical protein [uncultured Spirosoma sp.]
MHESREHLQTLTEIRSLMERSSKFLSLSGLSGVSAGVVALAGAFVVYTRFHWQTLLPAPYGDRITSQLHGSDRTFLILVAVAVLALALLFGVYFTIRKAHRQGLSVWNNSSRQLVRSMAIPLLTGGIFCLALLSYNLIWLALPSTLIFYGLALVSGSKHTLRDVESLGYCEIGLGLLTLCWPSYSLLAWATGFGLLHIIYGLAMYFKYERNTA